LRRREQLVRRLERLGRGVALPVQTLFGLGRGFLGRLGGGVFRVAHLGEEPRFLADQLVDSLPDDLLALLGVVLLHARRRRLGAGFRFEQVALGLIEP
jgi:hypothetical protein